ncbi:hypothetical protein A2Z10_03620 [Candidatus Azambacteria bacterium RBG_16_47_10]|uniref:DUF192 domain-containing protein n=1 Tax=Candidatus Azambacteria bacterium RBG_16_47_10 TaxID=1797292 RepID=A0A1F5B0G3_9BACT|nr:MAG: hypothetical protein A2Z10_03620 [Candidatus Azambacteria bacterium RBG_16_47_10]
MTAHKEAVKAFALLLFFFTVVILVFFFTVQKNIPSSKRQEIAKVAATPVPIAWDALTALTDDSTVRVEVGGVPVLAEVARSEAKKALGLSHRNALKEGEGMVFIFDTPSTLSFWNKDMQFAIDVLWMHNGIVAGISEGLPLFTADSAPVIITSPSPTQVVLEVPEGFAKQHAITNNNTVIIYENK